MNTAKQAMRPCRTIPLMLLAVCLCISASFITSAQAKTMTVNADTPACTSWAGWREWVQASLRPRGARLNPNCPEYIGKGTKVEVLEEDDGQGAARVRWRGKEWHTHFDRLN